MRVRDASRTVFARSVLDLGMASNSAVGQFVVPNYIVDINNPLQSLLEDSAKAAAYSAKTAQVALSSLSSDLLSASLDYSAVSPLGIQYTEAMNRLEIYQRFESNWDGFGASAISSGVIELSYSKALECARYLYSRSISPDEFEIGASGDGSVVIELRIQTRVLILTVRPTQELTVYRESDDLEDEFTLAQGDLAPWLDWLVNAEVREAKVLQNQWNSPHRKALSFSY